MSVITDIAEAVKDELNAGSFSETFTAERHYQPLFDMKEMKNLHVTVVPNDVTVHPASRGANQHDYRVDIAVQKRFKKDQPAELDPLMTLVEEIADSFRLKRLASFSTAMWMKTDYTAIYAPEHMEELRQFTSILTLTFRVLR